MIFPDEMELAIALYMADNALPRHGAIASLVKVGLENSGHLTGGSGRPPEIVEGKPSPNYVQYSSSIEDTV
ncbi:hypothetical protein [Agrobacterium sp. NPDC089420]|uniref:hypothetical protein n=1 Tax=Agrobacterium sp. NPDC089420 TaxID=3363918 RepID=UPI00384B2027